MEVWETFFSQGWVGATVGLVGILAGLLIALHFHRASKVGPRPSYQLSALRLIAEDERVLPEEVEIRFKSMNVPRLTKTHVVFWNAGNAKLEGKEVVDTDRLRFEFTKDAQLVRALVVKANRKTNDFEVEINDKSPNEAICHFDYLDAGDGVVIELLHTDKARYPAVRGTIRGVPKGISDYGNIAGFTIPSFLNFPPKRLTRRLFPFSALAIGILFTALGFLDPLIPSRSPPPEPSTEWVLVGLGLFYIVVFLLSLWIYKRRFPKSLMIEDFE